MGMSAGCSFLSHLVVLQCARVFPIIRQRCSFLSHLVVLQLSDKSNEVAKMTKIKKNLVTTNIILSALAATFFISSICFGYVSKSKYADINEMQTKVDWLKSQGASMNIQKCGTEKKWRWCVQIDPKAGEYSNNMRILQETN